jgi:radical SAM superfamily enzyme YgiQ (UPF0313 family)
MEMSKKVLFCFMPIPVNWNNGIAVLSSLCKARGIETELYRLQYFNDFVEHIRGKEYDLICFSFVIGIDFNRSCRFVDAALMFGFKVALGGTYLRRNTPNQFDGRCLICRGEGELLPDYILNGDTTIFDTQYIHPDIEDLPLPDYDLFKDTPYDREIPGFNGGYTIPYYSSRGCPWKCSFCEVNHQTGTVRIRRTVEKDLRHIIDTYHPDTLFLGDETTPYYDKGWRESWGELRFPFFAYIRADIKEDQLLWMIDRGMKGCAFGVESGDEEYRNKELGKNLSDDQIYRTVALLKKHNVHFVHFYMAGTKNETNRIKMSTYKMSRALGGEPIIFDYANLVYNTYQ